VAATLRGFTLTEVLLALGLITVALLALVGVLALSLRSSTQNRQATQAAQLAQQLFEEIRREGNCPSATVDYTGQPAVDGFPPAPYPGVQVEDTEYRLVVHGEPVGGRTGLYAVKVNVLWSQHQGQYECRFYQP
jgi:type II secretory pathway pseudopilin PulG